MFDVTLPKASKADRSDWVHIFGTTKPLNLETVDEGSCSPLSQTDLHNFYMAIQSTDHFRNIYNNHLFIPCERNHLILLWKQISLIIGTHFNWHSRNITLTMQAFRFPRPTSPNYNMINNVSFVVRRLAKLIIYICNLDTP